MNIKFRYLLFSTIYAITLTIIIAYLYMENEHQKKDYLDAQTKQYTIELHSTLQNLETTSHTIFETVINTPEIIQMFEDLYDADMLIRDKIRKKLFNHLKDKYEKLKLLNIRQLHFHHPKAVSFLRFHQPQSYGDNLWDIRYSLQIVNKTQQPVSGFEEGRVLSGFRNVYPLISNGKFLGSVEISYDFNAIKVKAEKNYPSVFNLIIPKTVVDEKLWEDLRKYYTQSPVNEQFYEENVNGKDLLLSKTSQYKILSNMEAINQKIRQQVPSFLFDHKVPFSKIVQTVKEDTYLITFVPIFNVEKNHAAFIIIYSEDKEYTNFNQEFYKKSMIIALMFYLFLYTIFQILQIRERTQKVKELDHSFKYLKSIFNTQKDLIIITNGNILADANQSFLSFFGYESIEAFKERYSCVCERFLDVEDKEYLQPYTHGLLWTEYIEKHPNDEHKVMLSDENQIEHVFRVVAEELYYYNKKSRLIIFQDITEMEIQKEVLALNSVTDELTQIYNRKYFNNELSRCFMKRCFEMGPVSMLMFDIDNFKRINDTFGHHIGDIVLQNVASLVSNSIRFEDTFCRWGGEEFAIILRTDINHGAILAEKIRETIAKFDFAEVGQVTCSFGLTSFLINDTQESIIKRVDSALYESKHTGKNRVTLI